MGWDQLADIQRENREAVERERRRPPDVCPYDGEELRLVRRRDGDWLHCPMGNYTVRA